MSGSTNSFPPAGLLDPAQGGQPPPGSGLAALYQAVNGNMMQQQGAVPTLGTGWTGAPPGQSGTTPQWTTAQWDANPQGPTAMARAAGAGQNAPAPDTSPAGILAQALGLPTQQQAMQQQDPATYGKPGDNAMWQRVQGLLGSAVGGGGQGGGGGGAGGDRGPSQGNAGQELAAEQAGEMAASGDKGPSAGGGSAASGHDSDEEGPF